MVHDAGERRFRSTISSRGRVLLPLSVARIPGGVWLHSSCRPVGILAQEVTGRLASAGVRLVPGRNVRWHSPIPPEDFSRWMDDTASIVGGDIPHFAVQLPSDPRRNRFALLMLDHAREPVAFAKFTRNPPRLFAQEVQRALSRLSLSFWFPTLIVTGEVAGWSFEVTEPLPNIRHRPARLDPPHRRRLVEEFQGSVTVTPERGDVVVHADFAPWNVRRLQDGRIAVIDWEEATAGPSAADELWHAVTAAVLDGVTASNAIERIMPQLGHHMSTEVASAAGFWLERHARPEQSEVDTTVEQRPDRLDFTLTVLETLRLIEARAASK